MRDIIKILLICIYDVNRYTVSSVYVELLLRDIWYQPKSVEAKHSVLKYSVYWFGLGYCMSMFAEYNAEMHV